MFYNSFCSNIPDCCHEFQGLGQDVIIIITIIIVITTEVISTILIKQVL